VYFQAAEMHVQEKDICGGRNLSRGDGEGDFVIETNGGLEKRQPALQKAEIGWLFLLCFAFRAKHRRLQRTLRP